VRGEEDAAGRPCWQLSRIRSGLPPVQATLCSAPFPQRTVLNGGLSPWPAENKSVVTTDQSRWGRGQYP
jgi:hypothetical protein